MTLFEVYINGAHTFNICCKDGVELINMLTKMAFLCQNISIRDAFYDLWFAWNGKFLVPHKQIGSYQRYLHIVAD